MECVVCKSGMWAIGIDADYVYWCRTCGTICTKKTIPGTMPMQNPQWYLPTTIGHAHTVGSVSESRDIVGFGAATVVPSHVMTELLKSCGWRFD